MTIFPGQHSGASDHITPSHPVNATPDRRPTLPTDMSTNQPNHSEAVHYASGRFEGRAIRGVLQELQAASLGRK